LVSNAKLFSEENRDAVQENLKVWPLNFTGDPSTEHSPAKKICNNGIMIEEYAPEPLKSEKMIDMEIFPMNAGKTNSRFTKKIFNHQNHVGRLLDVERSDRKNKLTTRDFPQRSNLGDLFKDRDTASLSLTHLKMKTIENSVLGHGSTLGNSRLFNSKKDESRCPSEPKLKILGNVSTIDFIKMKTLKNSRATSDLEEPATATNPNFFKRRFVSQQVVDDYHHKIASMMYGQFLAREALKWDGKETTEGPWDKSIPPNHQIASKNLTES
jgi:hypothetical protein